MATISDRMETPEHLSGKNDFIHENQIIEGSVSYTHLTLPTIYSV